jgi:hypothetical protein
MSGREHLSFNSAILQLVKESAGAIGSHVTMFCEASHGAELSSVLPGTDVSWVKICVIPGTRRNFLMKFVVELFVVTGILLHARKRGATVILLSVFPNVLTFLLLMAPILRKIRLRIVLHGELESLVIKEKQRIHKEGFWTKRAILGLFNGDWPILYVLGEGLRSRLILRFPDEPQLSRIRVLTHPYLFGPVPSVGSPGNTPIRIGFVGTGRIVRGIEDFFRLAESCADLIEGRLVEFIVVGGVERGASTAGREWVNVMAELPSGLDVNEFAAAIGRLDVAVLLNRSTYSFTASGSVFDIINEGVEIFSLPNSYIDDISRWDPEGGIKLFPDMRAIQDEIRDRLAKDRGFRRFTYSNIRARLNAGNLAEMRLSLLE